MSLAKSILVVQCRLGSRRVMLEAERPGRKRELIHYLNNSLFIQIFMIRPETKLTSESVTVPSCSIIRCKVG